ncbi:MAG: hypothetical protein AAF183_12990 [Pseudomonadota bacterium]
MTISVLSTPAPGGEPLTLDEAKDHVAFRGTDKDALLTTLIGEARAEAEAIINQHLITRRVRLTLDRFPANIVLPVWPVRAVHQVAYDDRDGVEQVLDASAWKLRTSRRPYEIWPAYGQSWPSTRGDIDDVRIDIDVGYSTPGEMSAAIKTAIKLILGTRYAHREDVVVGTVAAELPSSASRLLMPHKFWT